MPKKVIEEMTEIIYPLLYFVLFCFIKVVNIFRTLVQDLWTLYLGLLIGSDGNKAIL